MRQQPSDFEMVLHDQIDLDDRQATLERIAEILASVKTSQNVRELRNALQQIEDEIWEFLT